MENAKPSVGSFFNAVKDVFVHCILKDVLSNEVIPRSKQIVLLSAELAFSVLSIHSVHVTCSLHLFLYMYLQVNNKKYVGTYNTCSRFEF